MANPETEGVVWLKKGEPLYARQTIDIASKRWAHWDRKGEGFARWRWVGKMIGTVAPMVAIVAGMIVMEKNDFNNAALTFAISVETGLLRLITHRWLSPDNT